MDIVNLSPRLSKIAQAVAEPILRRTAAKQQGGGLTQGCARVADIGTDHAYIPIYLVQSNMFLTALATDIRPGPLEIAKANIKKYGLQSKIETLLTPGLTDVSADIVVIAGMGAYTIVDILTQAERIYNCYVLQPNDNLPHLYSYLYESNFQIVAEALALDSCKFYHIITVIPTDKPLQYNPQDLILNPALINGNDQLLPQYITNRLNKIEAILSKIGDADPNRRAELEFEKTTLSKYITIERTSNS